MDTSNKNVHAVISAINIYLIKVYYSMQYNRRTNYKIFKYIFLFILINTQHSLSDRILRK